MHFVNPFRNGQKTGMSGSRPQTNASRLWVAAGHLWPPFSNQMIIEGDGGIGFEQLKMAVKEASTANPGSRLILGGLPFKRKWVDSGDAPPVREVDGAAWTGFNLNGAPFLLDGLDIDSGPSCEVLLIKGEKPRIAFRTHHAVMDGMGTVTWAEDIFRVLRCEQPAGSEYFTTEHDLLNLTLQEKKPVIENYISPLGKAGRGSGFTWLRKRLEGSFPDLLPRIMLLTARESWLYGDGKVRIGLPVDLRSRQKGLRSTGNLTNAVFFNIDKETDVKQLGEQIRSRITSRNDGTLTWEDHVLKFIPPSLLTKFLARDAASSRKSGLYRFSAIISKMSEIPLPPFSCEGFEAESVYFVPPGNELSPVFIGLLPASSYLDIFLTVPSCYNEDGRVHAFMERLSSGLTDNISGI